MPCPQTLWAWAKTDRGLGLSERLCCEKPRTSCLRRKRVRVLRGETTRGAIARRPRYLVGSALARGPGEKGLLLGVDPRAWGKPRAGRVHTGSGSPLRERRTMISAARGVASSELPLHAMRARRGSMREVAQGSGAASLSTGRRIPLHSNGAHAPLRSYPGSLLADAMRDTSRRGARSRCLQGLRRRSPPMAWILLNVGRRKFSGRLMI